MYKYYKEQGAEGPYFYFYTELNLTYYVAFRNMSQENFPLNNLYSLDFGEVNKKKEKTTLNILYNIKYYNRVSRNRPIVSTSLFMR